MTKALFRFSFFCLLAVSVIAVLIMKTACPHKEASPVRTIGAAVSGARSDRPCPENIHHIVQKGETFAGILENFSVKPGFSEQLSRALRGAGCSKLYPGDSLVLEYDTNCFPSSLSLLSRLQYWYRATRADTAVTAEQQPLSVSVSREIINGTLETSLIDAMQGGGLGPYLACRLSDIFAWDINFFIDPRKGDMFQILFSRRFAAERCIGWGDILAARYTSVNGREYYAVGFHSINGLLQYYDLSGKSVQKEFLKAPLRYSRISSGFTHQRRHPIRGIVTPHLGIDYAAPPGTPVYAAADGIVRKAGYDKYYGNNIEIAHGGEFITCYGHMATISSSICGGKEVTQGQMIGTVGATGLATGPHLDYRMKRHDRAVNPLAVNLPSKQGIGRQETDSFTRIMESYCALLNCRFPLRRGHYIIDIARQDESQGTFQSKRKKQASDCAIKSGS